MSSRLEETIMQRNDEANAQRMQQEKKAARRAFIKKCFKIGAIITTAIVVLNIDTIQKMYRDYRWNHRPKPKKEFKVPKLDDRVVEEYTKEDGSLGRRLVFVKGPLAPSDKKQAAKAPAAPAP